MESTIRERIEFVAQLIITSHTYKQTEPTHQHSIFLRTYLVALLILYTRVHFTSRNADEIARDCFQFRKNKSESMKQ